LPNAFSAFSLPYYRDIYDVSDIIHDDHPSSFAEALYTMARNRVYSDDDIIKALKEGRGIVSAAARRVGMTRRQLSRRLKESEVLKEVRDDARAEFCDLAESKLVENVESGNVPSVLFALKCLGKDRGYVERAEVTGKDGKELGEIVIPKREVTLEEWKASLKDQEAAIQPMVRSAG
jgi:transposase-like protein|tara:strand:+ start:117 stop:647 length:531 start_codon:yes stop_codon:yes gene_type:complete